MRKDIISSIIGILVLTLLCGILYPLVVTGISQVAFPGNANGQRVYVNHKLVGSKIIGQNFGDQVYKNGKPEMQNGEPVTTPDPRYFQGRPSATVPPDNAAATTFSNLGPNNTATEQEISGNIKQYIQLNGRYYPGGLTAAKVPVDAANSSASGIDPDISPANADIQAYRISTVRRIARSKVMALVSQYTHGRGLGFSGEPLRIRPAVDEGSRRHDVGAGLEDADHLVHVEPHRVVDDAIGLEGQQRVDVIRGREPDRRESAQFADVLARLVFRPGVATDQLEIRALHDGLDRLLAHVAGRPLHDPNRHGFLRVVVCGRMGAHARVRAGPTPSCS